MELHALELAALHLPRTEWKWVRAAVHFTTVKSAADSFLWGAIVDGKVWAWHPRGNDLDVEGATSDAKVRVLVLKTDGSELEAFGLYLKTTFTAQPAQDIEWVIALKVISERLGFNPAERGLPPHWKEALEACGLEPHLGVLAQRARFSFLNDDEQKLIFEKRWDPSSLELAPSLTAETRKVFLEAARKWNLTAATAKESLNYALMLTKKMGEKTALNVLRNPFKNAEEFRTALFRTAQPELATLSQKRIEMLRGLKVPSRSSVFGDPSFESDLLKITHTPRKLSDFEAFKQWVSEPETTEKIRELLEIYQ